MDARPLLKFLIPPKDIAFLQRDRATIDRLITRGEKELRSKLHPDPYIGAADLLFSLESTG